MGTLDFSKLVSSTETFTDVDGAVHTFKAPVEFGALEMARLNKAKKGIDEAMKALGEDGTDEDAAQKFERSVNLMLSVILPTLPTERIAQLTLGQKAQITEYWGKANGVKAQAPTSAPASSD